MKTVRANPPNSLILVQDSEGGDIPISMDSSSMAATGSCIAIGTTSDLDEDTEISIGMCEEFDVELEPTFEFYLQVPSRKIVVQTVYIETLIELDLLGQEIFLRIWTNHPTEPNIIQICILDRKIL
jgi:hypothetical protein